MAFEFNMFKKRTNPEWFTEENEGWNIDAEPKFLNSICPDLYKEGKVEII